MLEDSGFVDVQISEAFDTFAGASGEKKARSFAVFGYTFMARRPESRGPDGSRR